MPADQQLTREQGPELYEINRALSEARFRYDDLIGRLANLGHRLMNTSLPEAKSSSANEKASQQEGLITELKNEATWYQMKNDQFNDVLVKLEKFV